MSSWGTLGANVTNKYVPVTVSVPPLKKRAHYFGNTIFGNHGHPCSPADLEIVSRRKFKSIYSDLGLGNWVALHLWSYLVQFLLKTQRILEI